MFSPYSAPCCDATGQRRRRESEKHDPASVYVIYLFFALLYMFQSKTAASSLKDEDRSNTKQQHTGTPV